MATNSCDKPEKDKLFVLPIKKRCVITLDVESLEKLYTSEYAKMTAFGEEIEQLSHSKELVAAIYPEAIALLDAPNEPYKLCPIVQQPNQMSQQQVWFITIQKYVRHHPWADQNIESTSDRLEKTGNVMTNAVAYETIENTIAQAAKLTAESEGSYNERTAEQLMLYKVEQYRHIADLMVKRRSAFCAGNIARRKVEKIRSAQEIIRSAVDIGIPKKAWDTISSLIPTCTRGHRKQYDRRKEKPSVITSITIPIGENHKEQIVIKRDIMGKYSQFGDFILISDTRSYSAYVRGVVTPSGNGFLCKYDANKSDDWKLFGYAFDALVEMGRRITTEPVEEYFRYIGKLRGQCSICGKNLTDAQSKERGMGPDCYKTLIENLY